MNKRYLENRRQEIENEIQELRHSIDNMQVALDPDDENYDQDRLYIMEAEFYMDDLKKELRHIEYRIFNAN